MADRIVFLVCDNFVEEANCALKELGFGDAWVMSFPSRCGRPPLSEGELAAIVVPLEDIRQVEVVGSCCLSQLEAIPSLRCSHRVNRLGSCFEFIAEGAVIDGYLRVGAYLTSPGWLKTWPESMEQQGLDREWARRMYGETIASVVLLDTGVAVKTDEMVRLFAEFVEKPYEVYLSGLSVTKLFLTQRVMEWRLKQFSGEVREVRTQAATYAMALDLMADLTQTVKEGQALTGMLEAFTMLFAPGQICCLTSMHGIPDRLLAIPPFVDRDEEEAARDSMAHFNKERGRTKSGKGFMLRATRKAGVGGVIMVEGLAFPEHLDQYQNLAVDVLKIGTIAIDNARKYEQLARTEALLEKANEELSRLAATDALTGIANRRAYDERMEVEWKRMLRTKSQMSLIVCDIDFFKGYNDFYGHEQGDICLQMTARIIHESVARPGDFVARYGGEEFVVILPETPLEGALHVAETIRAGIEESRMPNEGSAIMPYVTISIGVSTASFADGDETTATTLFNGADRALYLAKGDGRNCIRRMPAL